MSVATFANVDTTAVPAVRIPKLAVRNKTAPLDHDDSSARPPTATTMATNGSGDNSGQAASQSSSLRGPSPSSRSRRSDHSSSGSSGQTGRGGMMGHTASNAPTGGAKKKKSGMLGFLTMKEPSALALEEFAEAERQKAQVRGSRGNAAGVSSRKLPEHVPKVNSKWDGLPENAKRPGSDGKSMRSRGDSLASSSRRPSTQHSGWSNRSDETKRPIGSLSSRTPYSPSSIQRSALQSRGTVSSRQSTCAPIPNDDVHPAFRPIAIEETPDNLPQTFLYPPSPPRHSQRPPHSRLSYRGQHAFAQELPSTFGSVPELDTPDGPLPELESSYVISELDALRSRDATPVPMSPITPPTDDVDPPAYYSDGFAAATYNDAKTDHGTFFHSQSDTDHEDFAVRPKLPQQQQQQLRQPINFSRRRAGKVRPPSLGNVPETTSTTTPSGFTFRAEEQPTFSSTLKGSDGRIDPFLTDTFAAESRATGTIVERAPPAEEPVRASTSTRVSSSAGGMRSPGLSSTAATESTRPSTAAGDDDDDEDAGPDAYYTTATGGDETRRPSDGSVTPSVASAQWQMSPKERLGLGGPKIRKSEVSPWDGEAEVSVVSGGGLPSPTPTTDSKFKRLSHRFSGKR